VRSDPAFYRGAAELHDLVGDASKARRVLGWAPEMSFEELVALMVEADRTRIQSSAPAASS
jgi:GDPmannose 4,6-dehydratase